LLADVWMNTDLAGDVLRAVEVQPVDTLVIDCMLEGVLAGSREIGLPTAVLVHGLFHSILPMREPLLALGNQLRDRAGLDRLDVDQMKWESKDLVVVTTLREFDGVTVDPARNVRYVGPVLQAPPSQPTWQPSWDDDARPLILISLSTTPGQTAPAIGQRMLDAAHDPAFRVVMTSGAVPPDALAPPPNAVVFAAMPHGLILPHTKVMVTHAGHGSVMGALAHGVPLVCLPGVGADQPVVADRVQRLGLGKAVATDASTVQLHDAIKEVLETTSYREAAARVAQTIHEEDGATQGAAAVEHVAEVSHAG
jgi:MGT family glycosyltransferase